MGKKIRYTVKKKIGFIFSLTFQHKHIRPL